MVDFVTKTFLCLDELHTLLNPYVKRFYSDRDEAILVHAGIFKKFCQIMSAHDIRIDEANTWEFILRLNGHQYPMYLVWIRNESQKQMDFLLEVCTRSVYSFPWELTESIYQPVDRFHLVEDFISTRNLNKYIRKIRIDESRTFSSGRIKIIEFYETCSKEELMPFRHILDGHRVKIENVYYLTRAFNYLRPTYLNYLNISFYNPDVITLVLLLLDYHRAMMKRGHEIFDIYDLIAMKLAIDDSRLEYENCEFHKLIGKMLEDMSKRETYIKTNNFNLAGYRSGRVPRSNSRDIYHYLIYNFHNYFDRVNNYSDTKTFKINLSKIRTNDLVNYLVNCKNWLILDIDEVDLNERSADLLLLILTSSRLDKNAMIKIVWDTNFKWYYSGKPITQSLNNRQLNITFIFFGTNKYNFIENFLNWLKLVLGPRCSGLNFEFCRTEIGYPFVFTDMYTNEIIFRSTTLTYGLLYSLKRCHINRVIISECRLQNDHKLIECLENMEHARRINIEHEEHTFSIVIKYIEGQLESRSEFQFDKDIRITCYDYYDSGLPNRLCLKDFKFYINCERTKIETYHMNDKKLVNLYDYLYIDKFNNVNRAFEQRDEFMFYQ